MPWGIEDVDRFKKGLTDAQKRQWVRIANSVRARCIANGGKEAECDAMAVKQANGSVGDNMSTYQFAVNAYPIRTEKHQGKKHLVVPVVMMVEGVHSGSHGPLFHPVSELGKYPASWNGIPVSIQHPEKDGGYISANSPDIIDSTVVGRVYNTHVDNEKLKGEVWLDEEKLKQVSPVAFAYIMQQRPLDVSVGVFTDDEEEIGEWNGETYVAIARNHRPDHLALLPGGQGACSWEDGCGIRANEKGGDDGKMKRTKTKGGSAMKDDVKELLAMAPSVYTEADVEWLEALEEAQIQALLNCAKKATEAKTKHEEAEAKITAMQAEIAQLKEDLEKKEKEKEGKVEVNEEMALKVLEAQISDPAKFEKLLSPELRDQFQYGQKLYQEHRQSLIQHIVTNQATKVWTEEELKGRDSKDLEKIATSIKPLADYSAASGEQGFSDPQEVLLPVGVNEEKEDK